MGKLADVIKRYNEKAATLPMEKVRDLHKGLKTSWKDLVEYQNLQAQAHAMGKIRTEDAQVLYRIYGGESPSPEKWDKLSIGEKVVGTKAASELIDMKLKGRINPFGISSVVQCPLCRSVVAVGPSETRTEALSRHIAATGHNPRNPRTPMYGLTRDFYIPKKDVTILRKVGDAVVYGYKVGDTIYAMGFGGKRTKPDWHFRFPSIERRDAHIARWLQSIEQHEAAKVERRKPAPAGEQTYLPGTIIYNSWGYDQTNIDFYKIIKRTGVYVTLMPMTSREVPTPKAPWATGRVVAGEIKAGAKPLRRKVHVRDGRESGVAIESYGWASLWNGEPVGYTAYANPRRRGRNPGGKDLYSSFHGMEPAHSRKVKVAIPEGALIKIGRLMKLEYAPEGSTTHHNILFYHSMGDTGSKKLKSNTILATDKGGKNFFLIKDKPNGRPYFSSRGIIG